MKIELIRQKFNGTRGYKYKIGFNIDFITEDGANPNYTNDKLYKVLQILSINMSFLDSVNLHSETKG